MTALGSHGVLIKTHDFPRGRWLTPSGGLTQRRLRAGLDDEERAAQVAARLATDSRVEWAKAAKW